jgi:ribosomal protein S7
LKEQYEMPVQIASCQLVVQLTKFLLKLVDSEQQTYLYVIRYADQRVGRSMSIKLANEIIDTANDIGNTIKKKEETHKWQKRKAFAHFRY